MKNIIVLSLFAVLSISLFSFQLVDTETKMNEFISLLDGSESAATKAIKKYSTKEVVDNGMIPFGKDAKIVSVSGDCYTVALSWDEEMNKYEVCWTDNKISSFKWSE